MTKENMLELEERNREWSNGSSEHKFIIKQKLEEMRKLGMELKDDVRTGWFEAINFLQNIIERPELKVNPLCGNCKHAMALHSVVDQKNLICLVEDCKCKNFKGIYHGMV